jgi:hypothetical protein
VVLTAEGVDLGSEAANRLVSRAVRGRFDARVPLGGLPYGLRLDGVRVQQDGLDVTARADDTVLSAPPS